MVLERMRRTDTKEAARAEGIEIAREMLEQLLPHVQGAQIAAPFARYRTAIAVAEVIPPERRRPAGAEHPVGRLGRERRRGAK